MFTSVQPLCGHVDALLEPDHRFPRGRSIIIWYTGTWWISSRNYRSIRNTKYNVTSFPHDTELWKRSRWSFRWAAHHACSIAHDIKDIFLDEHHHSTIHFPKYIILLVSDTYGLRGTTKSLNRHESSLPTVMAKMKNEASALMTLTARV
jgi:hypothetical protein